MRLHRFFIEEQLRNKKEITIYDTDVIHQLKDVFRMRVGDRLILLDNSGFEYLSEIMLIARGQADIKIIDASTSENLPDPEKNIWLFAALIKKDNYEWILEKCTELGVSHFVPLLSDRTEKKDLNIERAQKIFKEASEQSGRGIMPVLHDVRDVKDGLTHAEEQNIKLIAFHTDKDAEIFSHEAREKLFKKYSFESKDSEKKLGILIGPEGGWTDREISLFKEKNISLYTLGNQILRAETAAIAISVLLLLL